MATQIYRDMIAHHEAEGDPEMLQLQHQVWDATPWMADVFTDGVNTDRWHILNEWLKGRHGPEAWPIHGRPGKWLRAGFTLHGWTWIGFETEEMMNEFVETFPNPSP